jgi:hypothetical protein
MVEIPFHEIGDFVFHCHILEHEDGGMMNIIRVRKSDDDDRETKLQKPVAPVHVHAKTAKSKPAASRQR